MSRAGISDDTMPSATKRATAGRAMSSSATTGRLHRYALIPSDLARLLGRRLSLIRPTERSYLSRYLHSTCSDQSGQRRGARVAASLARLSTGFRLVHFPDLRIDVPDAQNSTAASCRVLGAIDDLIENNRRRVELLEEMAQAIYREWFVHFRYPGHEEGPLVDSPLGLIPEGWDVVPASIDLSRSRRTEASSAVQSERKDSWMTVVRSRGSNLTHGWSVSTRPISCSYRRKGG